MALAEKWHPCGLLNQKPTTPYAVIILNQAVNKNALNAVISAASLLVCADGGADRLLAYEQQTGTTATGSVPNGSSDENDSDKRQYRHRLPDAIIGDLDSVSRRAEEHYRQRGVPVVKDPDQYSTDFTKCLSWIRDVLGEAPMDVVVLGGLGGRVDQGFSQIHHLFMAENDPGLLRGRIYLLSEQSLSFVLANGQNLIYLEPGYFAENLGIIPVLGKTLLTTEGLEWDVENWPTEFGGQGLDLCSPSNWMPDYQRVANNVNGAIDVVTLFGNDDKAGPEYSFPRRLKVISYQGGWGPNLILSRYPTST